MNEATRNAEEKQRILNLGAAIETPTPLDLQGKVYLKDGLIQRMMNGKAKDRYIIIYTDLILICIPIVRTTRGPPKYELESGYSLAELTLGPNSGKDTVKGSKNANIISLNVLSEGTDTILLMPNTPEESVKWLETLQLAFKDITEEHRSAVRSMDAQQRVVDRQSSMPDMFGRSTLGKTKGAKSGLSSIAMRRAASHKSHMESWTQSAGSEVTEPEVVKIAGVLYRRGISAIGIPYY